MANTTLALLRVSTVDQHVAVQRDAIERWAAASGSAPREIDWRVEEGVSGGAASRPVVDAVLRDARAGRVGTVVVTALDRLGRSAVRVLSNLDELNRLGVRVVSLREGVDLASPTGRLVAGIFASLAEFERVLIAERTKAGLASARTRGQRLGRPALRWTEAEIEELRCRRAAGETLDAIRASGTFRVFDTRDVAVTPSTRAMRRALASARA